MQDTISGEHLPFEIHTDRLTLRPWRLDDAEDVLAYATDPEWARYLPPVPQPYEPHHAVEFLTAQIAADRAVNPIWAIEFEGHAIGGTNLRLETTTARAETGYSISPAHSGKGFATAVCRAVIDHGFSHLPLNRIQAHHLAGNLASGRVMEKSGMTFEATLRHFIVHRGQPTDVLIYSILREEWESDRAR
jgi:[ribosomal protein S5]-alanine N-acetyltransferase